MAKVNYQENIYEAIDTLIDAKLQNVNFNSTVLCTIADDSKAASGIFTVDNTGVKFEATSMDKSFKVNDRVYVMIPNNDFDAQKIIIGKQEDFDKLKEEWKDPFNYLDIKYSFEDDNNVVSIIPTNNAQVTDILVKRIVLNGDFFNDLNNENDQYTTSSQAEIDLYNSGWNYYSNALDPSLTIDWSQQPFKAVLYRPDRQIYRIRTLDTQESIYATIPVGGGQPNHTQIAGQYSFTDKGWRDDDYNQTPPPNPPYSDPNYWIPFSQPFFVFYNERQYSPIPLAGLKNIIITADFKSDIAEKVSGITSGSYYLDCILSLTNINTSSQSADKTISLIMSSNQDFLGDPYNYFDYFTQTVLFDITDYQNYILNKIEFKLYQNGDFAKDENGTGNFSDSKIYIKNPKIYFGLPKQETEIGYAGYASTFRTTGKYYQKITRENIWEIEDNLKSIPPIDTELDTDGPFDFYIEGNYYKRYLPKLYYKDSQGNYTTSSIIKVKYYDEIYWIPNDSEISTHSWSNNKYNWDFENSKWVLRSNYTESDEYPAELEPYVCYLPGKQIVSYFGAIEKNNTAPKVGISSDEKNIDVVLSSSAKTANVVLEAYNNRSITLQGNDDIIIDNNNKSQIKLNEELLLIKNQMQSPDKTTGVKLEYNPPSVTNYNASIRIGESGSGLARKPVINLHVTDGSSSDNNKTLSLSSSTISALNNLVEVSDNIDLDNNLLEIKNNTSTNGKGIKLTNNPSGNGEVSIRLGYTNGQPAINISIQNTNGDRKDLSIDYNKLVTLANLLN